MDRIRALCLISRNINLMVPRHVVHRQVRGVAGAAVRDGFDFDQIGLAEFQQFHVVVELCHVPFAHEREPVDRALPFLLQSR